MIHAANFASPRPLPQTSCFLMPKVPGGGEGTIFCGLETCCPNGSTSKQFWYKYWCPFRDFGITMGLKFSKNVSSEDSGIHFQGFGVQLGIHFQHFGKNDSNVGLGIHFQGFGVQLGIHF